MRWSWAATASRCIAGISVGLSMSMSASARVLWTAKWSPRRRLSRRDRSRPVCRRGNVCGVMNSDQLFRTDSAQINAAGRQRLASFFRQAGAVSYIITGHTDSRASDEYNMNLSYRRANAVARVAQSVGARISDIRGYGERMPVASNKTRLGMSKNRRVEIICIR